MLSKSRIKLIHSLAQKKGRKESGLFVAEGPKVVGELLQAGFRARLIAATETWSAANSQAVADSDEFCEVSEEELRKVSFLQHPQEVLALFPMPVDQTNEGVWERFSCSQPLASGNLQLVLDGIQDPGNLGTIIRIADWFGIEDIFCSQETADVYNPKVVQASMGSIARVRVVYTDLCKMLETLPDNIPVYGTLLDGEDLYTQDFEPFGLLVMGNEGNGISPAIQRYVNRRLLIPNFPPGRPTTDSLNVAVATAVVCAEFRKRVKR